MVSGPAQSGKGRKRIAPPGYELPPLVWLRAFEASARLSSFTAAAIELNLTQSAVSHQVRSLEKYLGVTLFERLPRNLRLTEVGSAYLPPLRRSFDDLAAATAGLFGPIGRKTLVVRAPVSFAGLWLAPRLSSFVTRHPQISLRITSAVWAHSQVDEATDIDIRFGDGVWAGYHAELLKNYGAVAVCHPGLVPKGDIARRVHALSSGPLIHVTGYEDLWQRYFLPLGLSIPAYRGINIDTSIAALELAASGHGATIVLECFARPYIESGRLERPLDDVLAIEQSHYILTEEGARRQKPEAILFRNWLKCEVAAAGPAS